MSFFDERTPANVASVMMNLESHMSKEQQKSNDILGIEIPVFGKNWRIQLLIMDMVEALAKNGGTDWHAPVSEKTISSGRAGHNSSVFQLDWAVENGILTKDGDNYRLTQKAGDVLSAVMVKAAAGAMKILDETGHIEKTLVKPEIRNFTASIELSRVLNEQDRLAKAR